MQDYPSFADRGRRKQQDQGREPREFHDTGASLWVAAVVVIAALAVILTMSQDNLKNGGAPFVIVPPSQIALSPVNGG